MSEAQEEAEELLLNIHRYLYPEQWPDGTIPNNNGTPTALFYLSTRINEYILTHHATRLRPEAKAVKRGFTINPNDN